jgi:hypothetical protein
MRCDKTGSFRRLTYATCLSRLGGGDIAGELGKLKDGQTLRASGVQGQRHRDLFRRRVLDMLTAEGMVAYRLHRRSDGNGD